MNDRPIIMLTTPRSGSTPVYQIFELYLSTNFQVQGVEEILNPYYSHYREESGKIAWTRLANEFPVAEYAQRFNERLMLAKKFENKIFFKVFPVAFREESFEWLTTKFRYITHERENIQEQLLSYLVSAGAKSWYEEKGIKVQTPLKADFKDFKLFETSLFHYYQFKKLVKPVATISYEADFLQKKPEAILKEKGFTLPFPAENLHLVDKQNRQPKLDLFSNASEIRKWYEDSFFQQKRHWSEE